MTTNLIYQHFHQQPLKQSYIDEYLLLLNEKTTKATFSKTFRNASKISKLENLAVLIVDDEHRFSKAMKYILEEKYKAKVKAVDSGINAISHLKRNNVYDLIFLDIKMPGMDGIETYNHLRAMNITCRIVIMSAYAKSEQWEEAKELGVTLIEKPFPDDKLADIIEKLSR